MITENDVIGNGEPIYFVERQIINTGELFGDGEHIVYVNGANRNNATELGKLMHDFFCIDPDDMNFVELAEKVRYFKEDEKGVAAMCKVMEDMRNEAAKIAKWEQIVESVLRLLEMWLPLEQIAKGEGLTIDQVEQIAAMQKA